MNAIQTVHSVMRKQSTIMVRAITNQHGVVIPHDLNPPVKTQCSVRPPTMRKPSPTIKPINGECMNHHLHVVQHLTEA